MNANSDNISYARAQVAEARRRLESVHERVTETEEHLITGAIDERKEEGEVVVGPDIQDIPQEHRKIVGLSSTNKEVVNVEGHI